VNRTGLHNSSYGMSIGRGSRLSRAICAFVSLGLLATTAGQSAGAQRLEHQTLLIEPNIVRILTNDRLGLMVQDRDSNFFRVQGWPLSVWPITRTKFQPANPERRPGMLPDGIVLRGARNVRAAWLTTPTNCYQHGVLGDAVDAGGFAEEDPVGTIASYQLANDSVFEDRLARIVDIDGDGSD